MAIHRDMEDLRRRRRQHPQYAFVVLLPPLDANDSPYTLRENSETDMHYTPSRLAELVSFTAFRDYISAHQPYAKESGAPTQSYASGPSSYQFQYPRLAKYSESTPRSSYDSSDPYEPSSEGSSHAEAA